MTSFLRFNGAARHQPKIDEWLGSRRPDLAAIAREWFAQGTGRFMRHVKARPGSLPDSASLKALIHAAYADIKLKLATERGRTSGQ